MAGQMLYVVLESVEYEGDSIKGIFFDKEAAKKLKTKLSEAQRRSSVDYYIYAVKEGEEPVNFFLEDEN